jgi:hypothetical protein
VYEVPSCNAPSRHCTLKQNLKVSPEGEGFRPIVGSVNLQAGCLIWVSVPSYVMPNIRSRSGSSEGGSGETFLNLTPRDLSESVVDGRIKGGNNQGPMPAEKSDHLIVVTKPGNAGGAKGMTN